MIKIVILRAFDIKMARVTFTLEEEKSTMMKEN